MLSYLWDSQDPGLSNQARLKGKAKAANVHVELVLVGGSTRMTAGAAAGHPPTEHHVAGTGTAPLHTPVLDHAPRTIAQTPLKSSQIRHSIRTSRQERILQRRVHGIQE